MRLNVVKRQICLKIVYYGPGLSGKTTNLRCLHGLVDDARRGAMVQLDTETERTLFFDYFPLKLGSVQGYAVKVDLFTVPGQSFYHATRREVLHGADGVCFIADSAPSRELANQVSKDELVSALSREGRSLETLPHVYQWNRRDALRATPIQVLERTLNPERAPSFAAVATTGLGVWETQSSLLGLVVARLPRQFAAAAAHV